MISSAPLSTKQRRNGSTRALGPRLEKFGLTLGSEKTRILPFSRHQPQARDRFEFLGFECRWGRDRAGKAHLKRRTARKKLRTSLQRFTQWCRENRHRRLSVLFQQLNSKLRGYYHYYGVHGNSRSSSSSSPALQDPLEVAQSAEPTAQLQLAGLHGSPGALQGSATTDRGVSKDEKGNCDGLSWNADSEYG